MLCNRTNTQNMRGMKNEENSFCSSKEIIKDGYT